MHSGELPVRDVVKCILTWHEKIVLFKDATGRFNLPGGGRYPGEADEETLYRELEEEAGITPDDISEPQQSVTANGIVEVDGRKMHAFWNVYEAALLRGPSCLTPQNEILAIGAFSLQECLKMPSTDITEIGQAAIAAWYTTANP